MLSSLIKSKTRVELLTWFVTHPGERFHYNQLLRILEVSPTSIQKELKELERVGFLNSQKEAHVRFYWVNQDFVLYPEIKNIILKTVGIGEELKTSLADIGDIKTAFIYGSVAKDLEDARSDIDVMVIGDISEDALHEAIMTAEGKIGREVNYTIFSSANWKKELKAKGAFVRNVAEGKKIFLIGTEDDLRRLN